MRWFNELCRPGWRGRLFLLLVLGVVPLAAVPLGAGMAAVWHQAAVAPGQTAPASAPVRPGSPAALQLAQAPAQPQAVAVARPTPTPSSPTIWVGLSTGPGPLAIWSPRRLHVTDPLQPGRHLAVDAGEVLTVLTGPSATVATTNKTWTGPLVMRTGGRSWGAWQSGRISSPGALLRVTSDGNSPRYGRAYRGVLQVSPRGYTFDPAKHQGGLRLVNILPLEWYLRGVVPWEMSASAPLEALKAQAICARSETLSKIQGGRHTADGYHICDYDHCQGYTGTANETSRTDLAVAATAGLALMHGGAIADAVYGTNSGGITASSSDVWRGPPVPYLQGKPDISPGQHAAAVNLLKGRRDEAFWVRFCSTNLPSFAQPSAEQISSLAARRRRSPRTARLFAAGDLPEFYRWSRRFTPMELARALAPRLVVDNVTEMRVLQRTPSGRIRRLQVVGVRGTTPATLTLEGDGQVRSLVSGRLGSTVALPSSLFVVQPQRNAAGVLEAFVLRGAGWGHGAGMCQRGAQNRARYGWNARQILGFYFTNVQVQRLY